MPVSHPSDRLKSEIAAEIATRGQIPFARFMELCLYHPTLGYYTRGIGGGGGPGFRTSSGLHRGFRALLAPPGEENWGRGGGVGRYQFGGVGAGGGRVGACLRREGAAKPAV